MELKYAEISESFAGFYRTSDVYSAAKTGSAGA